MVYNNLVKINVDISILNIVNVKINIIERILLSFIRYVCLYCIPNLDIDCMFCVKKIYV